MGAVLVFPALGNRLGVGFSAAIWAVARAFPWANARPSACRCRSHPEASRLGSRLPAAKLCLSKGKLEGSSQWIQRLLVTPTLAFLSLPGFVVAKEHIKSEAAQLEGFPLPPRCLQGSCSGSQCSRTFSHFSSLCEAALENINVVPCVEGGEWNFVNYVFGDKEMCVATYSY